MPTQHRRIAITCDPEVERALRIARAFRAGPTADATVARDLILRGAEAVAVEAGPDEWQQMLVEKYGASPARGSLRELIDLSGPLPPPDPEDPYPATKALEELREDRL